MAPTTRAVQSARAGHVEGPEGDFEYHEIQEGHGGGGNILAQERDLTHIARYLARWL
jgi:hypothetical protein